MTEMVTDELADTPAAQQVGYGDPAALARVVERWRRCRRWSRRGRSRSCAASSRRAARGEAFLLQGGDCAESFDDCRAEPIAAKLKILLQMCLVLVHGTRKPVIRDRPHRRPVREAALGRRRDARRRHAARVPRRHRQPRRASRAEEREPDPELMLRAYERAGAHAQLHPRADRRRVRRPPSPRVLGRRRSRRARRTRAQYERIVESIRESLDFVAGDHRRRERGAAPRRLLHEPRGARAALRAGADAHACRAGRATTTCRRTSRGSACARAQLDGAHVEFLRGIRNPIGIKVGPAMTLDWLLGLLDVLDPEREPGRDHADPPHGRRQGRRPSCRRWSRRCAGAGRTVLWSAIRCTATPRPPPQGIKTRRFDKILAELEQSFDAPRRARLAPRRRPRRAHRRGRHRVHRRRARPRRGRPRARLQEPRRSAPQLRAGARDGDADRAPPAATSAATWCRRRLAGKRGLVLGAARELADPADDDGRVHRPDGDERDRQHGQGVGWRSASRSCSSCGGCFAHLTGTPALSARGRGRRRRARARARRLSSSGGAAARRCGRVPEVDRALAFEIGGDWPARARGARPGRARPRYRRARGSSPGPCRSPRSSRAASRPRPAPRWPGSPGRSAIPCSRP